MGERMKLLPPEFTYVNDPRIILSIDYAGYENFIGRPIAGYHAKCAILTKPAHAALIAVQDTLDSYQKGYRLKIFDAYRPTLAVADFKHWAGDPNDQKQKSIYYPDLDKAELHQRGYVAFEKSTHSRGSTVDLTITVASINPLNFDDLPMGTIFDLFGEKSHTEYPNISKTERNNRQFLKKLMENHGFKNYEKEWWHFTLENEPFPATYFEFPVQ
jgi:D-alanyl-D-alanine dipeptidase